MFRTLASVLALALITSACVADDGDCTTDECTADDDGPGGKADETHPTASTGTLNVNALPGGAPVSLLAVRDDSFVHTTVSMPPGTTRSLAPGRYCLVATIAGTGKVLEQDCSVQIAALVATTYTLGAVNFVHGRDELVYGWDLDPATLDAATFSRQMAPIPHPAGSFTYSLDDTLGMPLPISVAQGAETTVDVTDLPDASAVRILPSTNRVLPDPLATHPTMWLCTKTTAIARCFALRTGDKPLLWPRAGMEAELRFNGISKTTTSTTAAFAFPDTPGIRDVQMRRIDLNHPRVTLADGSVVTVTGKANIQLVQNLEGKLAFITLLLSQPTGFGVDVPPGRYDVTTSFIHPADGSPVVVHDILDLR